LCSYQEQLEALQLQLVTVVQERDAAMDKVREVEQKSNSDITLEELHALQTKEVSNISLYVYICVATTCLF
jgi:hypothetical protein